MAEEGWPSTPNPPASAPHVIGLQACVTMRIPYELLKNFTHAYNAF